MNIFGKIVGKLLEKQAKKVVENLSKDPILNKLSEETDKSSKKLDDSLKKAENSNK